MQGNRSNSYRTSPGLPQGWEVKRTKEGKQYYVDHNTRATHWELPPDVRQQAHQHQPDVRVHLPGGLPHGAAAPAGARGSDGPMLNAPSHGRHRQRSHSGGPRAGSTPALSANASNPFAMGVVGGPGAPGAPGGQPPPRPATSAYPMYGGAPHGGGPPHGAPMHAPSAPYLYGGQTMDVAQLMRMPASTSASAMPMGPMSPRTGRQVFINNTPAPEEDISKMEQAIGMVLTHGACLWYDPLGGFWGMLGRPSEGIIGAHKLSVPPIPKDASGGHTGVILNGRELHIVDLLVIQYVAKTDLKPGSYWMDPNGTFGKAVKKGEQPIVYGSLFE